MKAVIFDVDNTLYDTKQYFYGGFRKISMYLSEKYKFDNEKIVKDLIKIWEENTSMYPHIFDDFLKKYNIEEDVMKIVRVFNSYDGDLKPYDDVIGLLKTLRDKDYRLGIITDGNVQRQKNKIKKLGVASFFDYILYTKEVGCSKPSTIPFEKMMKELEVKPDETFYIGDNPVLDFEGAKKTGMKTVRVLKGEFKNLKTSEYVDFETDSFKEILSIIDER